MSISLLIFGIVTSLILSFFLIPVMIKIGHRFNLLDLPGKHKRHKKPIPILGGIALFIVTWTSLILTWLFLPSSFSDITGSIFYIFGGSLIITLVGLSDDLSPLSAWIKLSAQAAAGLLLYWGGLQYDLINTPFGVIEIGNYSVIITILWVVALTNAINLTCVIVAH